MLPFWNEYRYTPRQSSMLSCCFGRIRTHIVCGFVQADVYRSNAAKNFRVRKLAHDEENKSDHHISYRSHPALSYPQLFGLSYLRHYNFLRGIMPSYRNVNGDKLSAFPGIIGVYYHPPITYHLYCVMQFLDSGNWSGARRSYLNSCDIMRMTIKEVLFSTWT